MVETPKYLQVCRVSISQTDDYIATEQYIFLIVWPRCAAVLNLCLCRTTICKNCGGMSHTVLVRKLLEHLF